VQRESVADQVFEQLAREIVQGRMPVGGALPSERALSEVLGVNRNAIREAVKRLSQAGLVETRHGAGHQILDFYKTAGMDLLPRLLFRADGDLDVQLVRSVLEMRSAIAPDVARHAANRRTAAHVDELAAVVAQMREAGDELHALQLLDIRFWDLLVDASENVAYRLAFNSLQRLYGDVREMMAGLFADELLQTAQREALVDAVRKRRPEQAVALAASLVGIGLEQTRAAIEAFEAARDEAPAAAEPAPRGA
jgi:DNA-binding FadR family transcriptional regulator